MKGSLHVLDSNHDFNKTNLVTMQGGYDEYSCKRCGIKGKRHGLSDHITFTQVRKDLFEGCDGSASKFESRKIELTRTMSIANNPGLTSGTQWKTCQPPEEYKDDTGTWFQGPNDPIKVFPDEFKFVGQ